MMKILTGIVTIGLSVSLFLSLPANVMGAGVIPMNTTVERISGSDRYETATRIADELADQHGISFSTGGKFENVVLASGNNYPDALAGAPLANQEHAPILLLDSTPEASSQTLEYIKAHVKLSGDVYLLGGTGVIPLSFTEALKNLGFAPEKIHQLGGQNRNETSLIIAEKVANPLKVAVLVSDSNFYDALTIASAATSDTGSILLVSDSGLTAEQKAFCDRQETVVAIGEIVKNSGSIYSRAVGVAGANRYDSNALWSMQFKNNPFIFLATGEDYPDALAGAVLAGSLGAAPIYLTKPNELPQEIEAALNIASYNNKQAQTIKNEQGQMVSVPPVVYPKLYVLGGQGAVYTEIVKKAEEILNGPGFPMK